MSWSTSQQKRLGLEKSLLKDNFPGKVTWNDPGSRGKTRVEVAMNTNNGNQYNLRIYVPEDYPNSCPDMVVSYPNHPLKRRDGKILGFRDHALGTKDDRTQICHFRPNLWTNENTLYQVFMKGRIWLEAYELHLSTGKPMERFLRDMPPNINQPSDGNQPKTLQCLTLLIVFIGVLYVYFLFSTT